jgi:hypothetical protein
MDQASAAEEQRGVPKLLRSHCHIVLYYRCTLLQMHFTTDTLYYRCTLLQMHFTTDALYYRCTLLQIHFTTDALYYRCTLLQMHFTTDALYYRCTLLQIHFTTDDFTTITVLYSIYYRCILIVYVAGTSSRGDVRAACASTRCVVFYYLLCSIFLIAFYYLLCYCTCVGRMQRYKSIQTHIH